jgi:hypothetical protein
VGGIYGSPWHFLYAHGKCLVIPKSKVWWIGRLRILRIFLESREWSILCTSLYRFRTGQDQTRPSNKKQVPNGFEVDCHVDLRDLQRFSGRYGHL